MLMQVVASQVHTSSAAVEDLLSDAGMQRAVQRQVEQWLRLLQEVRDHGNVALACSHEGLPRPTYYRVWRQFRTGGIPGLSKAARRSIERSAGFRHQVDEIVIALSRANPTWGRHRVSKTLRGHGRDISARQVWCVWKRHGLLDRSSLVDDAANTVTSAAISFPVEASCTAPHALSAATLSLPTLPTIVAPSTDAVRSSMLSSGTVLSLVHASAL